MPNAQPPVGPRGPTGEYDHGHLYLPEYVPPAPRAPEVCRPLGRWWVNPSLELAWVPARPAPGSVRLRVPGGSGGVPGPILPVGGLATDDFRGGFRLWHLDDVRTLNGDENEKPPEPLRPSEWRLI